MRIKNVIYIYLISSIFFPKEGNAKGCSTYHKLHSFHMPARRCSKSFKVAFRHQICILSPCIFNLYAEYIMQNARLDEAKVGIKIARRNINNLRYADDTTLMAQSEEELNSLSMKVREWINWLKTNIQKTKIVASDPITSWQIDGETVETVTNFIFGAPKSLQMLTAAMKLKDSCSLEEKLWST